MGGDVIAWLQHYRGLSFDEACRWLGGEPVTGCPGQRPAHSPPLVSAVPPGLDWQQAAWSVVRQAAANLWNPVGVQALSYLKRRGLSGDTIAQAQLGFVPGHYGQWRTIDRFHVPCGITIPWFVGSELWAVKVRRGRGTPKYIQIAGGSASGLYNVESVDGQTAVLFVEGEFDALLAQQESGGLCGVVTLGSASNTLSHSWLTDLLSCRTILVAYDADEAGAQRRGASSGLDQPRPRRAIASKTKGVKKSTGRPIP
jgi:DNA primase